ncbi:hypothetical protein F1880_002017, partial [Penicillium rolfsii]
PGRAGTHVQSFHLTRIADHHEQPFPEIEAGRAKSVSRLKRIKVGCAIQLEDGSNDVDTDAIIFCIAPHALHESRWASASGSSDPLLPQLYQKIFFLDRPHSLEYMSIFSGLILGFLMSDLAQDWKGASPLISLIDMNMFVHAHHK